MSTRYRIADYHGDDEWLTLEVPTWVEREPRRVAELAAEDYHSAHDGWECSWPIPFIVELDGATYTVSVDRDMEPVFRAAKPEPR